MDFKAESGGLSFGRYYNSNNSVANNGNVGAGWVHTYTRALTVKEYALVEIHRPDGKIFHFKKNAGVWTSDADVTDQLIELINSVGARTGWTYTTADDEVENYDIVGKLLSITSRSGLTQTITYNCNTITAICPVMTPDADLMDTVTDSFGHQLSFTYDSSSRIHTMTDPVGDLYTFDYVANNNLSSVIYPDGAIRTYLYENVNFPNALTGIIDENGVRYVTYTYDANGRAKDEIFTAAGSNVNHYSIVYTLDDNGNPIASTVTDPLGTDRLYNFETILGVSKLTGSAQPGGSGCGMAASDMTYDANGNVARRTDFNGARTCYASDLARNLETVRLEGLPTGVACPADLASYAPSTAIDSVERKITTQWHPTLRLPLTMAEPLRITSYVYNGDVAGGSTFTCGYMADGITPVPGVQCGMSIQPTTDVTGALGLGATATATPPRNTSYTYNTAGQVLTVDGPRTDVADITTYSYTQGNLTGVTNALSQITHLGEYDANGRPSTITDPNGLVTHLYYDPRGRLKSRVAGSETTGYTYDGVGQLKTVSSPSGGTYTYHYDDAHRLDDIADNLGNHIHYTLDDMGNRKKEVIFDAPGIQGTPVQTHSREFDALNRLWKDIGAVNQLTTYEYDPNGNLKTITEHDPLGNRLTTNTYDALNRLITSVDPAGLTDYDYNARDQLHIVLDPRSLGTQYNRDGLDNLNQTDSPDTGTTMNTYDAAGNVFTRTDAKSQMATYTYDALNRLTNISYTDPNDTARNQSVAYQYDQGVNGIGHLTQITDSTGTIAYNYDIHGRVTGEVETLNGISYTTGYAYDTHGRLGSITYPSTRTVNYEFDGLGRVNRITTTHNGNTQVLASNILYQPFGGVKSFNFGNGQTYNRHYNQDGLIDNYTLNGNTMVIDYDAFSQVRSVGSTPSDTANYDYDSLSRLIGFNFNLGAVTQGFDYDANGNRIDQTGSTSNTYSYFPNNNWLDSILTGTATQTITHDANGSVTDDGSRQYTYDVRGRLEKTHTAQGDINYKVNALGLRVGKQVPYANTDTVYHYDILGHLIGESPTGTYHFTREYIYLGDQPIAVLE